MNHFSDFEFQKERFQKNLRKVAKQDQEFIQKAYNLAEKCHTEQKRDDGTPYFIHCLRITNNLMEKMQVFDKNSLAAALLHDSVEDTDLTVEEITEQLNQKTAEIVENLTRDTQGETSKNKYERKFAKHQETLKKDLETRVIKTLDHLDNAVCRLQIPTGHSPGKKLRRWMKEAETIHIPMAETVSIEIAQEIENILEKVKAL